MAALPDSPDHALADAERRFERILRERGEAICIASLPGLAEEIAKEEAGGDGDLEAAIVRRLRARAGLQP
ncbi:MAG TPA: hypothetical protein VFQ71_08025 [Gaiellales bacterium]|jgi:hypothetical protein|nr:hypothetical protein [Gaiellales bacterium]